MNEQSSFNSASDAAPVDLSKTSALSANPPVNAPANVNDSAASNDSPGDVATRTPIESLMAARGKGASWFFWIVGLSVINTLIATFGSDSGFSLGAAATLLSDGLANESIKQGGSGASRMFALFFDGIVFAFYAMCGVQAMRGATWAFVLGLVVFVLDTLVLLAVQEWLGVALHIWAIISIWSGLSANNKLKKLQLAQAAAAAPTPWSG